MWVFFSIFDAKLRADTKESVSKCEDDSSRKFLKNVFFYLYWARSNTNDNVFLISGNKLWSFEKTTPFFWTKQPPPPHGMLPVQYPKDSFGKKPPPHTSSRTHYVFWSGIFRSLWQNDDNYKKHFNQK
jgi:hypothetical protein